MEHRELATRLSLGGSGVLHHGLALPGARRNSTTKSLSGRVGECITIAANCIRIYRPGVAQSIAPGGPFGMNQQLPFVGAQFCPTGVPGYI